MPCSPRELLIAAQRIRELSVGDEAMERAAASRCYYAGLHMVLATFPKQRDRRDGEGSHVFIVSQARSYAQVNSNPGRTQAGGAAQLLSDVKPLRTVIDYTTMTDVLPAGTSNAIFLKVERIFELCDLVEVARKI